MASPFRKRLSGPRRSADQATELKFEYVHLCCDAEKIVVGQSAQPSAGQSPLGIRWHTAQNATT